GGGGGTGGEFKGKTYPTYFRFRGLGEGEVLTREAHIESQLRVAFETDAADDYLYRDLDPGSATLRIDTGDGLILMENWTIRGPRLGTANLTFDLPYFASVADTMAFEFEVTDPSRVEPFVNRLELTVRPAAKPHSGGRTGERRTSTTGTGKR